LACVVIGKTSITILRIRGSSGIGLMHIYIYTYIITYT
jgi:hypothetical protein